MYRGIDENLDDMHFHERIMIKIQYRRSFAKRKLFLDIKCKIESNEFFLKKLQAKGQIFLVKLEIFQGWK